MALPERECARRGCGVMFAPQRASAKYHSGACRAQAALDRKEDARAGKAEESAAGRVEAGYREITSALVRATRQQLERAEVADSPVGLAVLALAYRLENGFHESAPALAALNREFRAALEAALAKDTRHKDQVGDARMIAQQTRFRVAGQRAS